MPSPAISRSIPRCMACSVRRRERLGPLGLEGLVADGEGTVAGLGAEHLEPAVSGDVALAERGSTGERRGRRRRAPAGSSLVTIGVPPQRRSTAVVGAFTTTTSVLHVAERSRLPAFRTSAILRVYSFSWKTPGSSTPAARRRGIGKVGKGALATLHPQRLAADRAGRHPRPERPGHSRRRRRRLRHEHADGDPGRRPRPHGGARRRLRRRGSAGSRSTASAARASPPRAWRRASIMAGLEDVVVAGGAEMMSSYPANTKAAARSPFLDGGNLHLRALHPQTNQGVAADAIATLEGIPRPALDELAAESQRRAGEGDRRGAVRPEPRPGPPRRRHSRARPRGVPEAGHHGRRRSPTLPPSFAALADIPSDEAGTTYRQQVHRRFPGLDIDHVHHAGNSSGVVDGAAAILLRQPRLRPRPWPDAAGAGRGHQRTSVTTRR